VRDRHARDVIARDRARQVLPVPLGGMVPARRRRPAWLRRWRQYQTGMLFLLALSAAGGGAWLSTTPRTHVVSMGSGGVRVDDIVLTRSASEPATGFQVFTGAATLALSVPAPGIMRAGAVMTWNGHVTTGSCVVHMSGHATVESCDFNIGATRLAAVDTFDRASSTWRRRYSDGIDIAITVPDGSPLIPVPFPVGH